MTRGCARNGVTLGDIASHRVSLCQYGTLDGVAWDDIGCQYGTLDGVAWDDIGCQYGTLDVVAWDDIGCQYGTLDGMT